MRRYSAEQGNCLACCLAGIFDKPLVSIPSIHEWNQDKRGWFYPFYDYCKEQLGYIPVVTIDDTLDDLIHIDVHEQMYSGVGHAVIMKGDIILHDPDVNNQNEVKGQTQYKITFIPLEDSTQRHKVLEVPDEISRTTPDPGSEVL